MSKNMSEGRRYDEIADMLTSNKIDKKTAKEIVENFIKNDIVITTHAFEYIIKNKIYEDHEKGINSIIKSAIDNKTTIVTEEFIIEYYTKRSEGRKKIEEKEIIEEEGRSIDEKEEEGEKQHKKEKRYEDKKSTIKSNFKILDYKVTGGGKISDFAAYFQSRYKILSSIIKKKIEYRDATDIAKINEGEESVIIGMISDKFDGKDDSIILTVEDLTGDVKAIINKGRFSQIHSKVEKIIHGLVNDEVIGIKGRVAKGRKAMFISDIVEPDMPFDFVPNKADEDIYVAFTSDFHIGSNVFLYKEFKNFLEWLNLKRNRIDIAEKVKYILIAGDIVDGIGVYPHQEKELALSDIYMQYDFAADLISNIPEDIEIIISPGNHDAVRISEPQPQISKKFAPKFYDMKNVYLVGNPAYVNIEGVNVLMYHGEALDNLIRAIPGLSYSSPEKAMKEFLKKRHLSPIYADIFPSERDYLAIDSIPDVIHCGHVHSIGYDNYRNVHLINSGCFQSRTKFQEELGHIPTPSKIPVMNLKTHNITILDFGENTQGLA